MALGFFILDNIVNTITKVSEWVIACGGYDGKVTLLDISDTTSITALGSFAQENIVNTITKISEQVIACSGFKINRIDISDLTRPTFISSYMKLEPDVYEQLNNEALTLVNPNGWDYDNDKTLYSYAKFYDAKLKRVIPYFSVSDRRVKRSKDKTKLIIKRKKLDQDVWSFIDMIESNR